MKCIWRGFSEHPSPCSHSLRKELSLPEQFDYSWNMGPTISTTRLSVITFTYHNVICIRQADYQADYQGYPSWNKPFSEQWGTIQHLTISSIILHHPHRSQQDTESFSHVKSSFIHQNRAIVVLRERANILTSSIDFKISSTSEQCCNYALFNNFKMCWFNYY